jgi:glycosyltransferase involved in cell wall biosynthesis
VRPWRIAVVSGVCVEHDAISNALRDQAEILRAAGHEVVVFAMHAEGPDRDQVTVVPTSWALANHHRYVDADLAVFHFGVGYDLFNALLLQGGPPAVTHFHNVTPPELLDGAARAVSASSLAQLSIADRSVEVWLDSPYNGVELLRSCDVEPEVLRLMELRVPAADTPHRRSVPEPGSPLRMLTVGRFVEAKGLLDLVESMQHVPAHVGPVSLSLVGSLRFSNRGFVARLRAAIAEVPAHVEVEIVEDPTTDHLHALYRQSHLFVSASWHEGFCVPVIEALAAGCRVLTSDAGALPHTVGPCGKVAPVHDPAAFGAALAEVLAEIRSEDPSAAGPDERCLAHVRHFGTESYRSRLLAAVSRLVGATPAGAGSD